MRAASAALARLAATPRVIRQLWDAAAANANVIRKPPQEVSPIWLNSAPALNRRGFYCHGVYPVTMRRTKNTPTDLWPYRGYRLIVVVVRTEHFRESDHYLTVTLTGVEAMPLTTTSNWLAPFAVLPGTLKLAVTMREPVATPIELGLSVRQ